MYKIASICLLLFIFSCKSETPLDFKTINKNFTTYANTIDKIEYKMHSIDSSSGNEPWNNTGYALVEKASEDSIFGISFYGKRDDISKEYIYDNGNGFEISPKEKTYEIEYNSLGFLGSPGGQMVFGNQFVLDTIYKTVEVTENNNYYILNYTFEDNAKYEVTDIKKTILLDKQKFFPIKTIRTSKQLGNRTYSQREISDIKINSEVQNSVNDFKNKIKDYEIILPKEPEPNKLLNTIIPSIKLSNIFNENITIDLRTNKLTLLDFWEVWCGPCIASFPKVEKLKQIYSDNLVIIGISTEDKTNAINLINKKEVTFINTIGDNELRKRFSITSVPRYFLIDKNGIIKKEYYGFSDQIEKDIKTEIAELK